MLGAIIGDIVGSVYEFDYRKPDYNFELFPIDSFFTDDTVLTVALAESIMNKVPYQDVIKKYFELYPDVSYGLGFLHWVEKGCGEPYNSFGNGSAMRVSPVGWAFNDMGTVLIEAEKTAAITHNHPEGIKGAQVTASTIFIARTGGSKKDIKDYIVKNFHYNLDFNFEDLVRTYEFNESCQNTIPQAVYTFLISDSFEDSIRNAIMIGGDSDTLACINGSIAEAFYGIPGEIKSAAISKLDDYLKSVVNKFCLIHIGSL